MTYIWHNIIDDAKVEYNLCVKKIYIKQHNLLFVQHFKFGELGICGKYA